MWLPKVERALTGGALLAAREDVVMAASIVTPADFVDETLGMVWEVLPYVDEPSAFFVAQALWENGNYEAVGGEPRLVELSASWGLLMYSAPVFLEAHAEMVHEWGEKRRRLAALQVEAKAIYESGAKNVTPIYNRAEYQGVGLDVV